MTGLSDQDKQLVTRIWERIQAKLQRTTDSIKDNMPYKLRKDGKYDDRQEVFVWWTNSFWAGIQWLMYQQTGTEKHRHYAESIERKMDKFLHDYDGLDHDVGFLWLLTSVMSFETTGNEASRKRALLAANVLAARSTPAGGYIRAWNGEINNGQSIIDCMMNIPLLYWASEQLKDPRFRLVADLHARKTLASLMRPDGSVHHIGLFDTIGGEMIGNPRGQGYASGSSWSRGQSWALYGFTRSYSWTGEKDYLDAAKRTAHYILANLALNDYIPLCDYRQPADSPLRDSSAGAIAASALIDLAQCVPEAESRLYFKSAWRIVRALADHCAVWDETSEALLTNGTCRYHHDDFNDGVQNESLIYGDYYWVETIAKLKKLL